jgi:hypothetical protein
MKNSNVTFKVNQNSKYNDFRVDKYVDGIWVNQRDGNWSKQTAELVALTFRINTSKGYNTMSDNF